MIVIIFTLNNNTEQNLLKFKKVLKDIILF